MILYQEQHLKPAGTKAWAPYAENNMATTVAEAKDTKTGWQVRTDFSQFVRGEHMDTSGFAVERPAHKAHHTRMPRRGILVPRGLPTEVSDAISKVEKSATTTATLSRVMN